MLIKELSLLHSHINLFCIKYDKSRDISYTEAFQRYLYNRYSLKNFDICYNKYGKPYFKDNELYFNISHSGAWVICAVNEHEIGIDLQCINKRKNNFFREYLSLDEQQLSIKSWNQDKIFTLIWILKESYSKYKGSGLQIIDSIKVYSLTPKPEIYFRDSEEEYVFDYGLLDSSHMFALCYKGECKKNLSVNKLKRSEIIGN